MQSNHRIQYINDAYLEFMQCKHRFAVLFGSAGSGKSVAAAQKLVIRCLTETGGRDPLFRHKFAVMRKTKAALRKSVFDQIEVVCRNMGLFQMGLVKANKSEAYLDFRFANGAQIYTLGVDDPEKIKSMVCTGIWMEEATEFDEKDFNQINLRLRSASEYAEQIIITFNPVEETHWLKRVFFDRQTPSVYTLRTTYKDNQFLSKKYIESLETMYNYDENMKRIYVHGEWGRIKTGSEYYFNFNIHKHRVHDLEYIDGIPLHVSFDFNVNPYISATVAQIFRRDMPDGSSFYFVNVLDEFALKNPHNTTERLCEEIIQKHKHRLKYGVFIYGDATGQKRSTKSNITDYDIIEFSFREYMSNSSMRVPKGNPLTKKRRNFINKLLYGGFPIKYQISSECKLLLNDYLVAIEESDGSKKKTMAKDRLSHIVYEKDGHHADCADYFLCAAFETYFDNM